MTDEDSRKAFEEWSLQRCCVPLRSDVYTTFSAPDVLDAIQWATKRERERCAMLENEYRLLQRAFRECKEEIAIFSLHATQEAVGEIAAVRCKRLSILGPMGTLKEPAP